MDNLKYVGQPRFEDFCADVHIDIERQSTKPIEYILEHPCEVMQIIGELFVPNFCSSRFSDLSIYFDFIKTRGEERNQLESELPYYWNRISYWGFARRNFSSGDCSNFVAFGIEEPELKIDIRNTLFGICNKFRIPINIDHISLCDGSSSDMLCTIGRMLMTNVDLCLELGSDMLVGYLYYIYCHELNKRTLAVQ